MKDAAHHRWLAETEWQIRNDYERLHLEALRDPQRAGHGGEATWKSMLQDWLPPTYEVATRKYLIPEIGDDVFEVDLVVFSPGYPRVLRNREEVLAGGISAAFSVRLTADAAGLTDALERALRLQRGMKPRFGTPRAQLQGPFATGFLAHDHAWKKPGSDPSQNTFDVLDEWHRQINHPIEMLDYVCIPSLGLWNTLRMPYVPPSALSVNPAATSAQRTQGSVMTAVMRSDPASGAGPVAQFVGTLYQRLSYDDPTVRGLADNFRVSGTGGSGSGIQHLWELDKVYDHDVRRLLPIRGLSRGDPDWSTVLS